MLACFAMKHRENPSLYFAVVKFLWFWFLTAYILIDWEEIYTVTLIQIHILCFRLYLLLQFFFYVCGTAEPKEYAKPYLSLLNGTKIFLRF